MFYDKELRKMKKVFYKYGIRCQQNLKQKRHAPDDTEYKVIILNHYGMIDLSLPKVKYKQIRKAFDLSFKGGLLDKEKFKKIVKQRPYFRIEEDE